MVYFTVMEPATTQLRVRTTLLRTLERAVPKPLRGKRKHRTRVELAVESYLQDAEYLPKRKVS